MSKHVYLFISPHLDDVVLSCGGQIHRLTLAGEWVIIATVVTMDVPTGTPLSWLARRNHRAWRLDDAPFSGRRNEDIAAVERLGASYVHFDLLDAMYRRDAVGQPLYVSKSVDVPVHPYDWQNYEPIVRQKLQELLCAQASHTVRVFCPLAIGGHVDHLITRHAVEALCEPRCITYYEDYPYANRWKATQAQLNPNDKVGRWYPTTMALTPAEVEARTAAVRCYVSQLPGLFPSLLERTQEIIRARLPLIGHYLDKPPDPQTSSERMASSLRTYIARVGGERYWRHQIQQDNGNLTEDTPFEG